MTLPNIRDWYKTRKGTGNGIPVEHVSVNIVAQSYLQAQCDEFVSDMGITLVANDYNTDPGFGPTQTNACHDLFQPPFTKPVFLIINCVSNSPSHRQDLLLLNQSATPTDWNAQFVQWRAMIDSVQAPPPELTDLRLATNGAIRFTLPGQRARTNQVMVSSNLVDWAVLASFHGTNGPIVFRDTNVLSSPRRFYRLRRL